MAATSTIALTGASGFIGGAILDELLKRGYCVRALVRERSSIRQNSPLLRIVRGDLNHTDSLRELLNNTHVLIHCAGRVRGAYREEFIRTNAAAFEQLIEVGEQTSTLHRVVLISSLAAREPQISPYAQSKSAGEQKLQRAARHLSCIALRPPAVYGPGDREMRPLFKLMSNGIALRWADPNNRISLIHVDDLVAAIFQALSCEPAVRGTFELHDGRREGYTIDEIRRIAETVYRRKILGVRLPDVLLDFAAWCNLHCARTFNYQPMLTPWKVRELRHSSWVCDNTQIEAALNWTPRIDLAKGLATVFSASELSI